MLRSPVTARTGRSALFAAAILAVPFAADGAITIPGWFSVNWDRVGGWSLFIALCLLIVIGAFREWWVPGGRFRRLEASAEKQSETLANTVVSLREQTQANEITKHFFEKTVPTRGEPNE